MNSAKPREPLTCHECGLEALDECETLGKHMPAHDDRIPCKFCERNPRKDIDIISDFFSENWVLNLAKGETEPIIEDPTPHERALLGMLTRVQNIYAFYGR